MRYLTFVSLLMKFLLSSFQLLFFPDNYNIPKAFSFHGSYSLCVPEFSKGLNVIAVSNTNNKEDYKKRIEYCNEYFNVVELKDQLFNQYTNDETVYLNKLDTKRTN